MATIGLQNLYYATITEDADSFETYSAPQSLDRAISIDLSVEVVEQTLYADDGAVYVIKEFGGGKITINTADLKPSVISDLCGNTIDDAGILISASNDTGRAVAIGFSASKPEGGSRYFWLYKVKFSIPNVKLETKGSGISFSTPTIEGSIMRRNKPDTNGKNPWKAELNSLDPGVSPAVVAGWFTQVYEPLFSDHD
jgi:phi13 family phage major tail protein